MLHALQAEPLPPSHFFILNIQPEESLCFILLKRLNICHVCVMSVIFIILKHEIYYRQSIIYHYLNFSFLNENLLSYPTEIQNSKSSHLGFQVLFF